MGAYDIVGDVHGYADKLEGLLKVLGYKEHHGAFRCADRQMIFVGDLIDRGPQQADTVRLVRSMVDVGTAQIVMGNHEFNAISYATENPERPGDFMRSHEGEKGLTHQQDHKEFLEEFEFGSARHREVLSWFRTMPLWLSLDGIRIVHACWHEPSLHALRQALAASSGLSDHFIIEASTKGSPAHGLIESTLKGPELRLADYGAPPFRDKGMRLRYDARIRWWDDRATTLQEVAEIQPEALGEDMEPYPELPMTPCDKGEALRYDDVEPVFFGHYWRSGSPTLAGTRTICVDYSAGAKAEPLVAYRYEGPGDLSDKNFAAFPA
jgi:hypothetical protein